MPDPGGSPGALAWHVPGAFNDSIGAYDLVYNLATNTVLHFVFKSGQ